MGTSCAGVSEIVNQVGDDRDHEREKKCRTSGKIDPELYVIFGFVMRHTVIC